MKKLRLIVALLAMATLTVGLLAGCSCSAGGSDPPQREGRSAACPAPRDAGRTSRCWPGS